MDDQRLKALLAEYSVLAASFDKHSQVGYSILPVGLTVIGGATVLAQSSSPLSGLGTALLLLMLIGWIGSSHSMLNRIGLRLVAIELCIKAEMGGRDSEDAFFTSFVGRSSPGLRVYFSLFILTGFGLLALAMGNWWTTVGTWGWAGVWRILAVAVPVALNLFALATIGVVERHVNLQRSALIEGTEPLEVWVAVQEGSASA